MYRGGGVSSLDVECLLEDVEAAEPVRNAILDTEPDDEETCKDLEKKFPPSKTLVGWIPQDHETVYGKGIVTERSFGGTLHAFVDDRMIQETKKENIAAQMYGGAHNSSETVLPYPSVEVSVGKYTPKPVVSSWSP